MHNDRDTHGIDRGIPLPKIKPPYPSQPLLDLSQLVAFATLSGL